MGFLPQRTGGGDSALRDHARALRRSVVRLETVLEMGRVICADPLAASRLRLSALEARRAVELHRFESAGGLDSEWAMTLEEAEVAAGMWLPDGRRLPVWSPLGE